MGKTKNKKRITSDALRAKKSATKPHQADNPFELHINKKKFNILGRHRTDDRGRPGASRSKALQRRKDTLGQEYIHRNKNNKFRDKRLAIGGGTGEWMNKDEAANARAVADQLQKFRQASKKSLFNLNDDTLLTHKGQTLEEIEQFQDTISDDDDVDDEQLGKLDGQYTEVAHFGGGETADSGRNNRFDRQTAIDDLITEQKKRKIEISREKEEVNEMTHLLDENWRSVIPLMGKMRQTEDEQKPKPDDYDRTMREMIFEPRGAVSDKLKSAEELLKKDKERLEKLEKERRERMEGITEADKKAKHRSADDLDDGYFLQPIVPAQQATLAYEVNGGEGDKQQDSDEDDIENFEAEEQKPENDSDVDDEKSEEDSNDSDDAEDNLSDMQSSEEEAPNSQPLAKKAKQNDPATLSSTTSLPIRMSEVDRETMMKKAAAELPYTFELPDSYEQLEKLVAKHNAEYQSVIFERMIKSNHPKVMPETRHKFTTLFAFMMQHLNDTFHSANATTIGDNFRLLKLLSPHIFEVFNMDATTNCRCFRDVIIEKQADFRAQPNEYPSMDTLVFLKLVSLLFSTSDYRHSVVTPSFIFMGQLLSRCRVATRADISAGMFLVSIVLEYTQLSKRYLPAAMNFLVGVINMCLGKRPIEVSADVTPPFMSTGKQSTLLVLSATFDRTTSAFDDGDCLRASDLVSEHIDDNFRVRCLNTALRVATDMLTTIGENKCVQYLAAPFDRVVRKLTIERYPPFVGESRTACLKCIDAINAKPLEFLEMPHKKAPKSLRMMEPKFDVVYDEKRSHRTGSKAKVVRDGLVRKIKMETRGAIREIRRDNAFLAKVQHKQQMANDAERKEKVRRLFADASIQQGELNAMDRKKKHL